MCALGGRLISGQGGFLKRAPMVCHCLLIETDAGLVLVDTGIGTMEIGRPGQLGRLFGTVTRPTYEFSETALAHVQAAGFKPADVRHIIPTHLDLDHAGGIPDFPEARVHVHQQELAAARTARGVAGHRYRSYQFESAEFVQYDATSGDDWFGLGAIRQLQGVGDEILLIPLFGHSAGHCGVAVDSGDTWLLHAGDAYFHHDQMGSDPGCPPGLKIFQDVIQWNRQQRLDNLKRLNRMANQYSDQVDVFCAHDPVELDALS